MKSDAFLKTLEQYSALTWLQLIMLVTGITLLLLGLYVTRVAWRKRSWRVLRVVLAILLMPIALTLTTAGGYLFWFHHRSQPSAVSTTLFPGVTYQRWVRQSPRPLVIHIVTVDLVAAHARFNCTQPTSLGAFPVRASTVSHFLRGTGCQIAINGSYFSPYSSRYPWAYYPHEGDSVNVSGINACTGVVYRPRYWTDATFYATRDQRVDIFHNPSAPDVFNAISGGDVILREDVINPRMEVLLSARSGVGLSANRQTVYLIAVDGKQPGYSEGVGLPEFAAIFKAAGAAIAMNFDGGGSTTLVVQGADGNPKVLNSPCNFLVPGFERPVGNQLGISVR